MPFVIERGVEWLLNVRLPHPESVDTESRRKCRA